MGSHFNRMIKNDITNYAQQFRYEPTVKNADKVGRFGAVVVGGMGGSGLVAGILRALKPGLNVVAHHEYGLPSFVGGDGEKYLFIAVSHSGDTEETINFCEEAIKEGLPVAVVSAKGKLLELAEEKGLPYIDLPGDEVQPRMALGYALRAVLKLIGEEKLYKETTRLAEKLDPLRHEEHGRELAQKLSGAVPIVYASRFNQALAYNWKIKFNETGKIPAFCNVFPELNHNEMESFGERSAAGALLPKAHFVFLRDDADHLRIRERMELTAKLYSDCGLSVEDVMIEGKTRLERIFNTLLLGDWAAYYLALGNGVEPESVPMIERFKKDIGGQR